MEDWYASAQCGTLLQTGEKAKKQDYTIPGYQFRGLWRKGPEKLNRAFEVWTLSTF